MAQRTFDMNLSPERSLVLLQRCKVIGALRPNQRLLTQTGEEYGAETPSLLTSLRRWWNNETRDDNLTSVTHTINELVGCLKSTLREVQEQRRNASEVSTTQDAVGTDITLMRSERIAFVVTAIDHLEMAVTGLGTMRDTYGEDARSRARIDTLISNVQGEIANIVAAGQGVLHVSSQRTSAYVRSGSSALVPSASSVQSASDRQ